MDLDLVHVGYDKQRRVVEGAGIELQLLQGLGQVLSLALVLPGKVALLPDVSPAVTAAGLFGSALEGVPGAVRVDVRGLR
ncbi:MAG: hypothetical protein KGR26_15770, partial [Cyanobacteria bacterium REEB65]|nr:hypothetical protein [Cyanobacteria bacterium REEB65]